MLLGPPAARGAGAPARPRPGRNRWGWLALPAGAVLVLFFGVPLGDMALRSVTDPSPANYLVFAQSSVYGRTLWTTFQTAAVVTAACLLLGYPYAYAMHHAGGRGATVLAVLVLLPFWSSPLVRSFAWAALLEENGIINGLVMRLGITEAPLPLMRNTFGVTVGMSHILLPFMVLPLYAAMRRVDPDLVAAAQSLGARPGRAFRRVFLPLSLPGVLAGSLLVFVLSLGFFIVPAMLGSPRNAMFSELIVTEVTLLLKFGVGSAMAMVLLAITLGLLWLGSRAVRLDQMIGYDVR
jgi:putative spermidine/putrescine transport system permease protein